MARHDEQWADMMETRKISILWLTQDFFIFLLSISVDDVYQLLPFFSSMHGKEPMMRFKNVWCATQAPLKNMVSEDKLKPSAILWQPQSTNVWRNLSALNHPKIL